jgi:hypothetical protein
MAMPRISSGNAHLVFGGIVFLGLLAMTARHALDPDLWWHLRTGQWILDTGHIPRVDPFSFTREGTAWISHEWLSEVIFYSLWKLGGFAALIIFSSIVTSLGFVLLYLRCNGKPHWSAAATLLGAAAAAPCWGTRPQMFTFALASLLLWLIHLSETRPRFLLWIPVLFVLWLNLHAGFALGPALLLVYVAGLGAEVAVGTTAWTDARPIIIRTLVITAICMALIPLSPNGFQLYRYPFDTLRSPTMRSFIVEWFSPDFHRPLYIPFLLILLLLLAALARNRAPVRGCTLALLLFGCFAALDAVRHIPIFVLLAVPVLAEQLAGKRLARAKLLDPHRARSYPVFAPAVLALLAVFAVARWTSLASSQSAREASEFPKGAVAFLQTHPQPPRIFGYYDWGGYLIWNLFPRNLVFVDGRADLYGDQLLKNFQKTMQLRSGWEAAIRDWDVDTIVIPSNSALAQALNLNPDWIDSYRDSRSVVFLRGPKAASTFATNPPAKSAQK